MNHQRRKKDFGRKNNKYSSPLWYKSAAIHKKEEIFIRAVYSACKYFFFVSDEFKSGSRTFSLEKKPQKML